MKQNSQKHDIIFFLEGDEPGGPADGDKSRLLPIV